jgi:hypothetical protein
VLTTVVTTVELPTESGTVTVVEVVWVAPGTTMLAPVPV